MKKFLDYICTVLGLTLLFICISNCNAYASPAIQRLWGSNRYDTSLEISKYGWEQSDYAVLISGENFPDALCAAPLAKKYNAPLILVNDANLTKVSEELQRLKVHNVIIIGGTGSISDNIENALKINYNCRRIGGTDRYDTSAKIARELPSNGGIIIASGLNFPDGISASPIASDKGMPILLTGSQMNSYLKEYLSSNNNITSVYIIGGPAVVSETVKNSIYQFSKNVIRIYGQNRYDTNYELLKYFHYDTNLSGCYIASGENFPDALSGSALCALNASPIIIVNNDTEYSTDQYILQNKSKVEKMIILGGTAVINHRTVNKILDLSDTLIDNISSIKGSQQVIIVRAPSYTDYHVTVSAYEFSANEEKWNVFMPEISGVIGKNGFSANRHEGDKTTPVGTYGFPFLFGWYGNPGFKMPFRLANAGDYWVSNNTLSEYNVWIHYTGNPADRFNDYETLAAQPLYKYAAVIDFNYGPDKVLGKGSGIFLHIAPSSGGGTLGCIGIPEDKLLQILMWMDPSKNPIIIMGPDSVLNNMCN